MESNFNFCGTPVISKKRGLVTEVAISGHSSPALSFNLGVKDANGNIGYVEIFAFEPNVIKTKDMNDNEIEIDASDRFDENILANIPDYRKFVVQLDERKEFLTEYDMITYLQEIIPTYEGDIIVTGRYRKNYNPKSKTYNDRFSARGFYAARDDQKRQLKVRMDLYYTKGSFDKSDLVTEKKAHLGAFIPCYINKDLGTKFFPVQCVFNTAAYDMENERHKAQYDYKMKFLDVSNKTYVHILWDIVYVNGAQKVEFDESCLTDLQKQQIELGLASLDDFKPRGSIYGDSVKEFRLFRPHLTDEFADGLVDTELTESDFDDLKFVPSAPISMNDAINAASAAKAAAEAKTTAEPVSDDDLF